jgi:tripartite-type tricarboxylate transporter receptor subunit TctC
MPAILTSLPQNPVIRALLSVLLIVASTGVNGAYPEKPIRFIIPSAAGGSPDVLMRILTAEMSKRLGVPFVIINKPGANFVIGTMDIVKAPPDGYTLGYGNIVSLAINYGLLPSVPYEIDKDLTLVSNCVRVFNLLAVNNAVPVGSVRELIDYAKKYPDKLVMASGGNGTTGHLGGELFKAMTGTTMLHVPYRGSAQAINDVISGEAHVIFDNLASIGRYAKAGVRPLGGPGAASPLFRHPDHCEAGVPGYQTIAWRIIDLRTSTRQFTGNRRRPAVACGAQAIRGTRHRSRRQHAPGISRSDPARAAPVG